MVAGVALAELPFTSFAVGRERPLPEPPSAEVIWTRAASRGDRQAFGRLVDLHKRSVYGLCVRLLRDAEEARDAAQEAFARAYGALGSYDAAQPFASWLLRIARNHCLDVLRSRLPEAQRVELDADPGDAAPAELADPSAQRGDEAVARRELAGALERAVSALPANYREVVHLFHVEHLSYKEIAEALDVPMGTVMTWLHRARARLKETLTAGGTEIAS